MKELQRPSEELARRILAQVEFKDRLVGYQLRKRLGPTAVTLYSCGEVVGFLSEGFPQIKVNKLETWVRETMCDTELADEIRVLTKSNLNDRELLLGIRNLMAQRLVQSQRTV